MKGVKGYIYTPTPESDHCVFSGGSRIIRSNLGSSGVVTEQAKNTLEFPGPDHPDQGRIIRTYAVLTNTVWPDHPDQGRIIRPRAEILCKVFCE